MSYPKELSCLMAERLADHASEVSRYIQARRAAERESPTRPEAVETDGRLVVGGPGCVWARGTAPRDAAEEDEEAQAADRITWIGVGSNFALSTVQGYCGFMSGSAAVMADATHSFSDLVSDFV